MNKTLITELETIVTDLKKKPGINHEEAFRLAVQIQQNRILTEIAERIAPSPLQKAFDILDKMKANGVVRKVEDDNQPIS